MHAQQICFRSFLPPTRCRLSKRRCFSTSIEARRTIKRRGVVVFYWNRNYETLELPRSSEHNDVTRASMIIIVKETKPWGVPIVLVPAERLTIYRFAVSSASSASNHRPRSLDVKAADTKISLHARFFSICHFAILLLLDKEISFEVIAVDD